MGVSLSYSTNNLGPALTIIAWNFAFVSGIILALRYYARQRIANKVKLDDWVIYIAYVLAIMNSIFCTIAVSNGLGKHMTALRPEEIELSIKYIFICEFFSIMSPCFGRVSYTFLLLQIIPPKRWHRRFLYSIIAGQFVVDIGCVAISFSQCQPMRAYWMKDLPGSHCWSPIVQEYTGYFQGSYCAMVDLALAFFPASMFWNLKMKTIEKISLSILMGLGVFAMTCSIIKTIELRAIAETGDSTFAMASLAIWWTLEAYVVLLAASIPTLRPLFKGKRFWGAGPEERSESALSKHYAFDEMCNSQVRTVIGAGDKRASYETDSLRKLSDGASDDEPLSFSSFIRGPPSRGAAAGGAVSKPAPTASPSSGITRTVTVGQSHVARPL